MEHITLAAIIDQTLLKPEATRSDIAKFIEKSAPYGFATLCLPPCHVKEAFRMLKGSQAKIRTVTGFPLGFQSEGIKLLEAKKAVDDGAAEVDMVMNISLFRSGEYGAVADEISGVVHALPDTVVKVIIETGFLTDDEKIKALEASVSAGALYVKTSTGFNPGKATVHDVLLLTKAAAGRIKIKASGGIRGLEDALRMIEAGAGRLGTSAGADIIEELTARAGM